MFCTNCGKKLPFEAKVCPFCNSEIIIEEENEQDDEENKANNTETDRKELEENTYMVLNEGGQALVKISDDDSSDENGKNFSYYKYKKHDMPLSTASFFFMQVVFLIPFINIFLLLIWAFKKNINSNRKAYARSMLIWFLSISVILLFLLVIMIFMRYPIDAGFWFQQFKSFINSIPEF